MIDQDKSKELEEKIDKILSEETEESLISWLNNKRKKQRKDYHT